MISSFIGQRRKRRALLAGAVSVVALFATLELTVGPTAWAIAAHNGDDMFSNLQTVSDEKLAQERGKLMANGLSVTLGAMITTLVNGQVALQSKFSLPDGMNFHMDSQTGFLTQPLGPPNGPFTVTNGNGSSTQTSGQNNGTPNVPNVNITGGTIQTTQTVTITDQNNPNLKTVATSQITPTGALNLLTNNANGRSVTQQIQFAVTINNFSQFQQQLIVAQNLSHVLSTVQGVLGHSH